MLLLAPAAALLVAAFPSQPLLAHWTHTFNWTHTFMGSAVGFVAQFFPLFLLGALLGKPIEDSGSVAAIARAISARLGAGRAILAAELAGALVTQGGVSLLGAFFVLGPMARRVSRPPTSRAA